MKKSLLNSGSIVTHFTIRMIQVSFSALSELIPSQNWQCRGYLVTLRRFYPSETSTRLNRRPEGAVLPVSVGAPWQKDDPL